ncbi:potassium/proton antiporter [Methanoculleus formosensis]|uniref:potassium/proton antiporter n=1 Tax=Methanoculleus formosensis TaxID=2590886 RepID=UPI0021C09394|nr:potassium/proton antiporter [Methanoculleus sp. Afa-1]
MVLTLELVFIGIAVLFLISIIANKFSERLGVPALLIFLIVGMLAGSEGPGGIPFDDPTLAQLIGIIALAYILFSGGLDTRWEEIQPVLWQGIALSTIGVVLTAVLLGAFAVLVLGFSPLTGLLLGAVVSSTDAAAVFSILRTARARLKGNLRPFLEFESGSNDPMAVLLTTGIIGLILTPGSSIFSLVPTFAQQMAVGGLMGYALGKFTVWFINRIKLETEGLYPVLTLAMVLLVYGLTTVIGGNGFIAVYLAGLIIGNSVIIHKKSLIRFYDGIAWLMQIVMFLALGLLVFPSQLASAFVPGLLAALFLIFIARPVSVLLTLLPWKMPMNEKALVSWVGLRGAVPIILATYPLVAGVSDADAIFNIVFFIVIFSALVHGTSIPSVARWLGLAGPLEETGKLSREFDVDPDTPSELLELVIPPDASAVGKQVVDLGLPKGTLIILMQKGDERFVPVGSTVIGARDTLLLLTTDEMTESVRACLLNCEEPCNVAGSPPLPETFSCTAIVEKDPEQVEPDQPVVFGGSATVSGDCTATVSEMAWDFGDGTTGKGETVSHVYATAGTYTVTLAVTLSDGIVCRATTDVTVVDPREPGSSPAGITASGNLVPGGVDTLDD